MYYIKRQGSNHWYAQCGHATDAIELCRSLSKRLKIKLFCEDRDGYVICEFDQGELIPMER